MLVFLYVAGSGVFGPSFFLAVLFCCESLYLVFCSPSTPYATLLLDCLCLE
ncbi:hypothetical protein MtrunA17_Chr1g0201401 [Medicago truncatula]|uniref:Transmembrane protein n=1 Tax=Medicago truncatula TaxID=3880 RepID=A0A396K0N6_MEDTR|nr:hypothetical protein MtrunA17_Chr1g0201401 [Medicago truncatula]